MTRSRARGDHGQATVELALCLPVVVIALLAVLQVAVVARDHVLVAHAAREAARAVAVGADQATAAEVAGALVGARPEAPARDRPRFWFCWFKTVCRGRLHPVDRRAGHRCRAR